MSTNIPYEYLLNKLLNKVNKVTAAHRHGNVPSKEALDELCERQLKIEEFIRLNEKEQ